MIFSNWRVLEPSLRSQPSPNSQRIARIRPSFSIRFAPPNTCGSYPFGVDLDQIDLPNSQSLRLVIQGRDYYLGSGGVLVPVRCYHRWSVIRKSRIVVQLRWSGRVTQACVDCGHMLQFIAEHHGLQFLKSVRAGAQTLSHALPFPRLAWRRVRCSIQCWRPRPRTSCRAEGIVGPDVFRGARRFPNRGGVGHGPLYRVQITLSKIRACLTPDFAATTFRSRALTFKIKRPASVDENIDHGFYGTTGAFRSPPAGTGQRPAAAAVGATDWILLRADTEYDVPKAVQVAALFSAQFPAGQTVAAHAET